MDKEWLNKKKQPFYSEMDVSNQAQDIPFISFKSSDPSLRESPKLVLKTAATGCFNGYHPGKFNPISWDTNTTPTTL